MGEKSKRNKSTDELGTKIARSRERVFPKPALIYQPNDDWEFRILGELNFTSFRTDDVVSHTQHKLDLHNAIVQYSEDRAGVQVGYSGIKHLKLIAGAGVTVETEF